MNSPQLAADSSQRAACSSRRLTAPRGCRHAVHRMPAAAGCLLLAACCLLLAPTNARAQTVAPSGVSRGPSFRGFGTAGMTIFTASDSFKAVFDSSVGPLFGGGIEVGVRRDLFVTVAASRFARTGRRLFAFQGQIFDLNEPTEVKITPLEVSVGYRFSVSAKSKWSPYVGGGIGWHRYTETSPGATDAEDAHETFTGYQVMGGVERPLRNWIALAGEGQFTWVPNALGQSPSSVSSVYDEHDLGGLTLRVKVVIGR
jgi:opacity protein-like surface antigen